ncbi:hypothetical protein [Thalassotalea sp. ND16A]|uniref:hypothetical protein n=1 Tax=Thalassotalea sp. ND16A TaxID=1535422 RepID=UPI000519EC96|nr:hypothetical protein [Thalassotalea sp. ND16A]KGJ97124.1 hypothetical protein ND16A_0046 [Thalassotalea sp. ND16A]
MKDNIFICQHDSESNTPEPTKPELSEQQIRRQFIAKFGKLAAITPIALTALMSPKTSVAQSSRACQNKNPPKWCNENNNKKNGF